MHAYFEIESLSDLIRDLNLEEGGIAQLTFANEIHILSDDYVPMDSGQLKNNYYVTEGGKNVIYDSIYAQYQWYGILMVDPINLKGAFFNNNYGFLSRPGVPKIIDPQNRPLNNFNGIRGPYWVERMWADRKEEIEAAVLNSIRSGYND